MLPVIFSFFVCTTLLVYAIFALREERRSSLKRRMALVAGTSGYASSASNKGEARSSNAAGGREGEEAGRTGAGGPSGGEFQAVREGLLGAAATLPRKLARLLAMHIRRRFRRNMTEEQEARMELRLLQAGRPGGMTPMDYRMLQLALFLLLPLLFCGWAFLIKLSFGGKLFAALAGFIGAALLPGFWLRLRIRARSKQALRDLPDVLDLLTVSLEAGLGFDSALSKLVSRKEGVLTGEFQRCLEEIRLGKTRRDALNGVRERLDLQEIKTLVSSILQAEKLGIGLVQVLRVQCHEVREQRKQRAEEEAMKAPIKMLFPLVLFIFPSLFIVLLGPAVIQFIETFSK